MKAIKKIITTLLTLSLVMGLNMSACITAFADSCGGIAEEDIFTPDTEDVIQDPVLHWAVRSALNSIKDTHLITKELIGSSRMDYISYESGAHPEVFKDWKKPWLITSLEGLQYATSMTKLDISYSDAREGSSIGDLSPIAKLKKIYTLKLYHDGITDISSLAGLTNMQDLNLGGNNITDISAVENMTGLKKLALSYNEISDVSVIRNLSSLEFLDLTSNSVSGLPDMSELMALTSLNLSHNNLTDADVTKIAQATNIRELNLGGNSEITDVRPLSVLTDLDESLTFLPVSDAVKADLFAAIEVNKAFEIINISKMTVDDLGDADAAVAAYNVLTESQKTYVNSDMVRACENNIQLVKNGQEPEYYPEYDRGGTVRPIWNRLSVRVVNRKGEPVEGATVIKTAMGTKTLTTDTRGMVTVNHFVSDSNFDCSLRVDVPEGYICKPEKIDYEVRDGKTYIIDGKKATGLETLEFKLMPAEDNVDVSRLEALIKECKEQITDSFRYTSETYEVYERTLSAAESVVSSTSADQEKIDKAASDLSNAKTGLKLAKHLTVVKVNIRDKNNNRFIRRFKLQVYKMPGKVGPWNIWAELDDNAAYLETSPAWQDGEIYNIACCNHEAFKFDKNIKVEIGVDENGDRYFKKIDDKPVDATFEITKLVQPIPESIDPSMEIRPNGSGLEDYIEKAKKYSSDAYTPSSYKVLVDAVDNAQSLIDRAEEYSAGGVAGGIGHDTFVVTQEEFNAAAVSIDAAIRQLKEQANRIVLEKLLSTVSGYTEEYYTKSSWKEFMSAVDSARQVYEDENADQSQIDNAVEAFRSGTRKLVARASAYEREQLAGKIENAEKLNESDYISGWDSFQNALKSARDTLADEDATAQDVKRAGENLDDAVSELKKPSKDVDYSCYPAVFRALVVDENDKPVPGVRFQQVIDGKTYDLISNAGTTVSNSNGIIEHNLWIENQNKTTLIRVADSNYNSEDTHTFKASGANVNLMSIKEIDGMPYEDGIKLKFVVKPGSGSGEITDPDNPGEEDPDNPGQDEADKNELKIQIDIAESMLNREKDYTTESWSAMKSALSNAKSVMMDNGASQAEVDSAANKLKEARETLIVAEKPFVSDSSNIRILVVDQDGNRIKTPVKYTMIPLYSIEHETTNGFIEYVLSDGDQGVSSVVVALVDETITIDGHKYTAETMEHRFGLNSSSLGVKIDTIDDVKLEGTKDVKFVYKKDDAAPEKPELNDLGSMKLSAVSYIYNGGLKAPKVTVTDKNGNVLTAGEDYKLTGTVTAKKPGTYTIKATGCGEYKGQLSMSFRISVKTTVVSSLTRGKKAFTVKVARRASSNVTGYQIRYSLKSSMGSAKTVTVGTKPSAVKKKVKKLKGGRKYYVQARAYKTVSGKKYYSAWSTKKSVKTK